jgi:hypothetical protein
VVRAISRGLRYEEVRMAGKNKKGGSSGSSQTGKAKRKDK